MSNGSSANAGAAGGIGLVTVILALVFLFVWPGPFRYEYRDLPPSSSPIPATKEIPGTDYWVSASDVSTAVVKIDRISHQIWDYNSDEHKWVKR